MRRVKPSYWYAPPAGFCKYGAESFKEGDRYEGSEFRVCLVTDPKAALAFWERHSFPGPAAWLRAGGSGPYMDPRDSTNVWVLSPDPGKEINGDS